ncbi:hypothetical protein [Streptomyces cyanogenus]|uniref:Uncharacterized protein n=1 Tax=Streptomyces cyanogenus TaxID=80860 RepID=A0ABX7TJM3_STRCY|nr:hypothetical protein [Streptomyces cyanogenus]QTD96546.1 hypothetical protein S1361_04250 [Streptomyces cyanogenus]
MPSHPQPRRITLGGREAVALTPEEYEQLVASRRQIGGQSARVRVLAQQARRTERLLHDLETLIDTRGGTCPDPGCLRCAVAELLRRHRAAQPGRA